MGLTGTDALPDSDSDGDAIPLYLEYALGLNPKERSKDGYPEPRVNGSHLEFQFSRRFPADLTYFVENPFLPAPGNIVATLLPGATAWTGPATVTETGTGATRRVVVSDPTAIGTVSNHYLRLRVVGSP